MSWALKRQILYIVLLILFFSAFGFLIVAPRFQKAPTCFDNKQNGDEAGVDCGGSCMRACVSQVEEVSVLWARAFRVIPGRYNAVAYVENPPSGKIAVFEPGIDIGNSIPVYTTFEFTEVPVWVQVAQEKINQAQIFISNIRLMDESTSPKLTVSVKNNSFSEVSELGIVAILYDQNHNAISVSRTFIDTLAEEERRDVSFTWPEPFSAAVVVKEVIPIYNFWSK